MSRPRGGLTRDRHKRLALLSAKATAARTALRAEALQALSEGGSFASVAEVTGLSTNTLQRWKREAQNLDTP